MNMNENTNPMDIKIAYIGGGSRGWAWGLMSDLASADDISGRVDLYDIDFDAAKNNEIIGNKFNLAEGSKSNWKYTARNTLDEALDGADFVVISILPGTFEEMDSDVHLPEKYGIFQPVGDTTGPGGIIRALRSIPMMEVIAKAVEKNCPNAWVINYTNPMSVCVRALYDTFPKIKAFGCCHEVFGTQKVLAAALADIKGLKDVHHKDIKVNVVGVNHYTWITRAQYKSYDLFPIYEEFAEKYKDTGVKNSDENWANKHFHSKERVKFDLFLRYKQIAAAGDRHLAEFSPGDWYLKDPEMVEKWGYHLTTVKWRKEDLAARLERSARLVSGEETVKLSNTGEDGVNQIRALLGLCELVTNVNIPNQGQIPNLPQGSIVETNAAFRANSVEPIFAGDIPMEIYSLVARVAAEEEMVAKAARTRNLSLAFEAFVADPLVRIPLDDARELFEQMVENTKGYLGEYFSAK